MQRTTIILPIELKIAAEELGISVGKLICDALQLPLKQTKGDKSCDLLFSSFPVYDGNILGDLAKNHDSYLY